MSGIKSILDKLFQDLEHMNWNVPYLYSVKDDFSPGKDWIYYSGPSWDLLEVKAAVESLLNGKWIVAGEQCSQFEHSFSKKFGIAHSLMVNSGSSANLIMIAAMKKFFKWNDGDEIIVSPVGFPTTIAPIVQNNLSPIFIDINLIDLNFRIEDIANSITAKTKAIFLSPVLGNPPDMDQLVDIIEDNNIHLILDGCDSLGSKWNGRDLMSYATASSCSFYPAHHISTGEGGMVSSNIDELIRLARSFAWWGRGCYCSGKQNLLSNGICGKRFDSWLPDSDMTIDHKYYFTNMGYNLKPLDLQGSIGLCQLEKFDNLHQLRKHNKNKISAIFRDILGDMVHIPVNHVKADVGWFGVPVVCKSAKIKKELVCFLETNKIQTRNYFAGNILQHPGYSYLDDSRKYKNANEVLKKVFFVGCHPSYSDKVFNYYIEVLQKFKQSYSE